MCFPRNLDVLFGQLERISTRVAALTEGRFRIQAFPAGEIVPGLQVMDAVQGGTVECGHTAAYYFIGKEPGLAFLTAMPFGLNTRQQTAWARSVPRASSPTTAPASTSPLPDVASPAYPVDICHRRPDGSATSP